MIDYKQQVIEALEKDDWFKVMQIAEIARSITAEETYFGMKKGFFNVINTNRDYKVAKKLISKICTVYSGTYAPIIKGIKSGKITEKTPSFENITAIVTNSDTMKTRLGEHKLPAIQFEFRTKTNRFDYPRPSQEEIWKKFILKNMETNEEFEISEDIIKSIQRDKQINSILED